MAARSCLHLLIILAAGVLQAARAQPDSNGLISIDCGLSGTAGYVDNATKLSYSPDAAFTDAGTNNNISVEYFSPANSRIFDNVRSFPSGAAPRSCYTLRSSGVPEHLIPYLIIFICFLVVLTVILLKN